MDNDTAAPALVDLAVMNAARTEAARLACSGYYQTYEEVQCLAEASGARLVRDDGWYRHWELDHPEGGLITFYAGINSYTRARTGSRIRRVR